MSVKPLHAATRLVALVRAWRPLAADTECQALVQRCLIDAAAAAAAACGSCAVNAASSVARAQWAAGPARVWFDGGPGLSVTGATFVNAVALSALDIDDGNRLARGHLSAAVLPAAVAVGARCAAGAPDFVHAILAGSEVSARLGSAERSPYFASGRWAGIGSAVSAGLLLGLDDHQLENAITLAVHAAPVMGPAGARAAMTGHIKEGVPFGALTGITAALLAREGFRGDPDAIESSGIYDVAMLKPDDATPFAFRRTYFKIYGCCRLAHAPIDASMALLSRHGLRAADIRSIAVHTFQAAIGLPNEPEPASFESAQYSLPFCIAVALVHGKQALLPLSTSLLRDREVCDLARRIVLLREPAFEPLYPGATPTRVRLLTTEGDAFDEPRETAEGDPSAPFSLQVMLEKFDRLAARSLNAELRRHVSKSLGSRIPSAAEYESLLSGQPIAGVDA